jgi:hypothetical protein
MRPRGILESDCESAINNSLRISNELLQELGIPMKTLFLQAPSFDGFDGGAGSR